MANKLTFDPLTRTIQIIEAPDVDGEIFIDIKTDLYSDGKEDWVADESLRRLQFPISSVGGNPTVGSKKLGSTFFIRSDWKIKPYESSHKLAINGNFYAEDGSDPFLDTVGAFTVRIVYSVSSLVDATVQQLQEIEYASFSGGVTVDVLSDNTGTGKNLAGYLVGTAPAAVNNMTDALLIAQQRGLTTFYVVGDLTLGEALTFDEYSFYGSSIDKTTITIDPDANVDKCEFYEASIQGTLDGQTKLRNCLIKNITYVSGYVELCVLDGNIVLGGGSDAYFLDCWAGTKQATPPCIDMGGTGQTLVLQNFNGGIKIINKSGISDECNISLNAGEILLDSTVTAGSINVIGVGAVHDDSNGATVNIEHLMNPDTGALAVWAYER